MTGPTLQARARERKLLETTLVWTEGMPHWVPARTIPFLFAPLRPGDDGLNFILPIGPQSGLAIAAGYLGLFSLIPGLSLVTGPVAIILGILALSDLKKHPEKRGMGRAITALVCGPIGILLGLVLILGTR